MIPRNPVLIAAVNLLAVVLCAASFAESDDEYLDGYRMTSWSGGDGVTLGSVWSIGQTPDGFIWLASQAGLVRFDGVRFTTDIVNGTKGLPLAASRAVYVARDGSVWVGYGGGEGVYQIADGEIRNSYLKNYIKGFVNAIVQDRSGSLWVGDSGGGLYRLTGANWETIPLAPQAPPGAVLDIYEDHAGVLWVATANGLFRRVTSGAFERWHIGNAASVISEDGEGHLWAADRQAGVRRIDAFGTTFGFDAFGKAILHDTHGNLWVSTMGQGLFQISPPARAGAPRSVRHVTTRRGLPNDENSRMLEDREGNIWIGSIGGLIRLSPDKFSAIVDLGIVSALTVGRDGTSWVGTTSGLIRLIGATPHSHGVLQMVSTLPVRALHTTNSGTVWIGTDRGLFRLVGDRLSLNPIGTAQLRRITSITSDARGAVWICDERDGLVRVEGTRVTSVPNVGAGRSASPLFAYMAPSGNLWVAFPGGIVRRWDSTGRTNTFATEKGFDGTSLAVLFEDRYGVTWAGGSNGLSRFDGEHFRRVAVRNDEPWRRVSAITEDDDGALWVGYSGLGLIRIDRDEIARDASNTARNVRYRIYGTAAGAGAWPQGLFGGNVARSADGSLWFATTRGITLFDPRAVRAADSPFPTQPRVDALIADGRRYAARPGVTLPAGVSRLRVDYTSLSLSSLGRIHFRYRLDGFDTQWVDGTAPLQALYTNLSPGSYRFRLQAWTNGSDWTDGDKALSFSIEPMFYQTRWFYALLVVSTGLCIASLWRLRLQKLRNQLSLVYAERSRLSREIHDTLLQSLGAAALNLDAASRTLRNSDPRVYAEIMSVRDALHESMRETRQSIWNLRSPMLERTGVVAALKAAGEALTKGRARFVFTVSGTPRRCSATVETHVLRVGREAIMNAIRHSHACLVEMDIAFDREVLRLRVSDDGGGFNDDDAESSGALRHYGLLSMKERASEAGGSCSVESRRGTGVEVLAEFPLAPTA